jgi:putative phosphoesterase
MIGILADSHDNLTAVRQAVRLFADAGCSLVIHAGDFVAPFAAREFGAVRCPVKAVFGNCDGEKSGLKAALEPFGQIQEAPLKFTSAGFRFGVVHLDSAVEALVAAKAYDVIVCGHTHKPEVRKSGKTLVVNPGEAGGWTTGKSTVSLFDPKTGQAQIISL